MSIFSCFDNVIGVSRKADLCVDDAYVDNSDSGLYIDELPGMSLRILNATGGNTFLLEKMANAKENSINAFKVDVLREILKTKEPARSKFIGDIGGKSFTSKLASDTYHGLRMYSDIKGGTFTLRGITLILDTAYVLPATVTLQIFSGDDDEDGGSELTHIHLNSLAGRPKYNAITPIQLPLDGDLYFLYQAAGLPYNNKLT